MTNVTKIDLTRFRERCGNGGVMKHKTGKAIAAAIRDLARAVDRLAVTPRGVGGQQYTIIGERGPEFGLGGGGGVGGAPGGVHPVRPVGGSGSGGAVMHLTMNMPMPADRDAVIAAIRKFDERSGSGWRQ